MSMASQVIREWMGIQQFPPATQTKLLELLGKLKQEVIIFFPFLSEFECNPCRHRLLFLLKLALYLDIYRFNNVYIYNHLECEHIDHTCDGEGWRWEIINCKLYHRRESGYC